MRQTILFLSLLLFTSPSLAAPDWPDLSIPAPPQGGGEKDVAIIVGVENYAELPKIKGASSNAESWYQYFTITRGIPANRVSLLNNKKGTREKILKALQEKSKLTTKGGTLWFIFIGHGASGDAKNGGLLLGYDTQSEIDSLQERSVSVLEALEAIKKGKHARVVTLLDTGLNGHIPEGDLFFGIEHDHLSKKAGLKDLAAAHKKKSRQDAVLLTAAQGEQYAGALAGAALPAFSCLALGGVRGWADNNQDGQVSAQELRDYIASVMLLMARDQVQTPGLGASNAELKLSPSTEESPDLVDLFTGASASNTPKNNPSKNPPNTTKPITPNTTKEDPLTSTSRLGGGEKTPEPSAANSSQKNIEDLILVKINAARSKQGRAPLVQNAKLLQAARDHSQEMAELGYFSHQSPTRGRESFVDRIQLAGAKGFSTAGENIVFRQENVSDAEMAEALFQQWMNSPGHRENILTDEFLVTGLGVFQDGSRCWATQVFADQVK